MIFELFVLIIDWVPNGLVFETPHMAGEKSMNLNWLDVVFAVVLGLVDANPFLDLVLSPLAWFLGVIS